MASPKSVRLETPAGRFYATPTGYKTAARSPVLAPAAVYGGLSRGDARRLRKAAHAAGLVRHAAVRRG